MPYCEAQAASTPPSAKTEPTDRSMPPVMMTKVMPSATTARKEAWIVTPRALSRCANVGKMNRGGDHDGQQDRERAVPLGQESAGAVPAGLPGCAAGVFCGTGARAAVTGLVSFIGSAAPGPT